MNDAGFLHDAAVLAARGIPRDTIIAIITDAWEPQVNGVVRTLGETRAQLERLGYAVELISPKDYRSLPCPTYPEIRLALSFPGAVGRRLKELRPHAIHIATEGPLGLAARRYCVRTATPFTSAFHTQFPDYLARRTNLPPGVFWPYIRWFHRAARQTMVATTSLADQLHANGIERLHRWSRGVDLAQFSPDQTAPAEYNGLTGPILLYVGRIAVEKNLEAFLNSSYPGTRIVIGDGPAKPDLQQRFPDAKFLGARATSELAPYYAHADVFVFPSRTDTFGLVMIEALACGTPIAAFPVPGPADIVTDKCGALSDDLDRAIDAARFSRQGDCVSRAKQFTWERATRQFVNGLALEETGTP